ncbi:MAG TPA: thiamine-phosphate kinase, partial [Gammaproteobacteria bacterium]|nr:thiamine-phosphate kinase [Gammaproteobacteria bacterium]
YQIDLVGGDTTRGPLTLTLQAHGVVPVGKAIRRDGAQAGDLICVTNRLGAAGYALQQLQQGQEAANIRHHLERPMPCVEAGLRLRGYASAMVDVSDGLLADLEHILQRSGVGAKLDLESIPFHPALAELSVEQQLNFALVAGDEYQLCFTLPQEAYPLLCRELEEIAVPITVVGEVEKGNQLKWSGDWSPASRGYQHF